MAMYTDSEKFARHVFSSSLDDAIDWIKSNMEVDKVFDVADIHEFVKDTATPQDVFDEDVLQEWAEENGYVQSED